MGLFDDCQIYFKTKKLYEVLNVDRSASEVQLKNAYRKLSLLYHPDKVEQNKKDEATRKFQVVSQVYSILSDKSKRELYDDTGVIDDENSLLSEDNDWENFWRQLFPQITEADIDNFLKKYKGSKEEEEDLKNYYIQYEGDFDLISEYLIGYQFEDEARYRDILNNSIKNKDIPNFPKYKESKSKQSARQKRLQKEAKECEALFKEAGLVEGDDESLIKAITKKSKTRESQFDDMIKNLEQKYAKPKAAGRKKKN